MARTPLDLSTWPTKDAAAREIGISPRSLERLITNHELHTRRWRRPTGGPPIAVCNPEDVDRLAKQRTAAQDRPDVMAPGAGAGAASTALQLKRAPPALVDAIAAQVVARVFAHRDRTPAHLKTWLTVSEAADVAGLPVSEIRRAVRDQRLPSRKTGRGYRIRRRDLDAFDLPD